MSGLDNNTIANNFKRIYENKDALKNEQNLYSPFWAMFEGSSDRLSPSGTYTAQIFAGDETGGAMFSTGSFDTSENPDIQNPTIKPRYMNYPFQIYKNTLELSENTDAAFGNAMDMAIRDKRARALADMDRQAMGIGTGQITLANGAGVATTSLVVDDVKPFRRNMYIDAWTALGGTKEINNIKITAVDYSTKTLTLASAQTWTDNDIICRAGKCDGVTSIDTAKEMVGWLGIDDTNAYSTTFEGLAVASVPEWQAQVYDAGAATISQDTLQRIADRVAIVSGETPEKLVSTRGQARNFKNTELNKTRYEGGEVKAGAVKMYWDKYEWMTIDRFPEGEIGLISPKFIQKYQTQDLHLTKTPGTGSFFQVQGQDAFGSYFSFIGNLGIKRKRNAQGRVTNLSEPSF